MRIGCSPPARDPRPSVDTPVRRNAVFAQLTLRTIRLVSDQSKTPGLERHSVWVWLGSGAIVIALLAAGIVAVPRMFHSDPCDHALPFASELGLQLSEKEEVLSCEWHSSFPNSGGTVMVRTDSPAAREALLERSGVSEEITGSRVSVNDGPIRVETRRPNLERSEQVYMAISPLGHRLKIIYDEGAESGLLLTVHATQM